MVEDIDLIVLEEQYGGDERAYIADNYTLGGRYSWDWITVTEYFPKDNKVPCCVHFESIL